jgi:hypothetical protein
LKAEGALVGPLQHNLSEGRDYIAGATTNNLLVLKNRKGRNRTSPIELPDNILAGPVFESISDATQMVAIDAEGRLHRFYLDGSKDNTNLAVSVISSIFVDVDEDGVIDIVYNDQAGVFASTLSGEVKYKFDPGAAGAYEIQIIDNGDIQRVGLSSSVANNSYILNKKGNPIHTEPLPASGKLAWLNDSTPLAVIAGGNLIQCFAIE